MVYKVPDNAQDIWWYRAITKMNWFSFRYYWFVWLMFIGLSSLLFYLIYMSPKEEACDQTALINTANRIDSLLNNCCNCLQQQAVVPPLPPHDTASQPVYNFAADFLIITYQFDENGGQDLDTKTEIVSPINSGPRGYSYRQTENDYMIWSGDNTGSGVESCLIDLTKFNGNANVAIKCAANWFASEKRQNGNMSLDVRAYEGGTMSFSNFQFYNTGGRESGTASFRKNITGIKAINNQPIGTIFYDKGSKTLRFQSAE